MKHRRFKYFSKLEYAEEFLDGKVFCQTAAFFRDYEDAQAQQIVGDEYEGTRLYRPLNGVEINNLTRNLSGVVDAGVEFITNAHEIYVFCMSHSFNDVLKKEFNAAACAEILDPRTFIRRWLNALPEAAKQEGKHVASRVRYYRPEDLPGNVWALPDLLSVSGRVSVWPIRQRTHLLLRTARFKSLTAKPDPHRSRRSISGKHWSWAISVTFAESTRFRRSLAPVLPPQRRRYPGQSMATCGKRGAPL